jgi:hypothetical protein
MISSGFAGGNEHSGRGFRKARGLGATKSAAFFVQQLGKKPASIKI